MASKKSKTKSVKVRGYSRAANKVKTYYRKKRGT